jgi:hypothetical protein
LLQALRVSIGKLGVIVRVKFHIIPETVTRRTLKALNPVEWVGLLKGAQQQWNEGGRLPDWVNDGEAFWIVQKQQVRRAGEGG